MNFQNEISNKTSSQGTDEAHLFLEGVYSSMINTIELYANDILKEMTLDHFKSRGKMLRPLFIYKLAKVFDLAPKEVLGWATACELLHNATLIHDDLQDGDVVRRGRPSIWKKFGSEQAINIGDFLLVIAPNSLISTNHKKVELLKFYTHMSTKIVCGQVSEFEFNKFKSREVDFMNQYLECISGKTSTLFSGLALGVGLLSDQSDEVLSNLEEIFFKLGHLFQMQDDVLDLFGDKMRLEQGCDIKEGKFSFLVAKHLENNPTDFDDITRILLLSREETTKEDITYMSDLFIKKGTLNACMLDIHTRINEVLENQFLISNKDFELMIEELIARLMKPINHIKVDYAN